MGLLGSGRKRPQWVGREQRRDAPLVGSRRMGMAFFSDKVLTGVIYREKSEFWG